MFGRLGKALEVQGDEFDSSRAKLKVSLTGFRERVGQLISFIPRDMPGYTVHDLTHLDALWEMADIIVGPDYCLNPAEAFVLGGAILLHDAGMTVAAYLGEKKEVERTVEYSTALAAARVQLSADRLTPAALEERAREAAFVETLRLLHPKKAEELATQHWKSRADAAGIYLLDDDDLRVHYGQLIGRIAHSHHWDHGALQREFISPLGAAPHFPADWSVDPLKVALILRCADASHLDARRAPRLLFSLGRIHGVSIDHWVFQGMLAKPVISEGKLLYASTSDFSIDKAEAWQLAFDTLKMVDSELRSAAEINIQKSYQRFLVDGVLGAGAPDQLAQYVRVKGWKPVALNLRVSNVPHLARTLGGKDLYSFGLAPLRELIQNAADSIEARVAIDADFNTADGKICVVVTDDSRETITIEVSDNGVGMSERVLTGSLLDFGFSFWKSAEARREFPTLQTAGLSPRGRYGIGFFSIFMWAEEVEVTSRMYSLSASETNVLHFREGLDARPILRAAEPGERTMTWSTKVKLRVPRSVATRVLQGPSADYEYRLPRARKAFSDWGAAVRLLCAALPIAVELNLNGVKQNASLPDWRVVPSNQFVDFFKDVVFDTSDALYQRFSGGLTNLVADTQIVGRAFIVPAASEYGAHFTLATYDRGIFAGISSSSHISGVVEGQVKNAARERYISPVFRDNLSWVKEASERAFALCAHDGEQLAVQRSLLALNHISEVRPIFIRDRQVVSWAALMEHLRTAERLSLRFFEKEEDEFTLKATDSIVPIYGLSVDADRVYSLLEMPGKISKYMTLKDFVDSDDSMLAVFLRACRDCFGSDHEVKADVVEKEGYRSDHMDVVFVRN